MSDLFGKYVHVLMLLMWIAVVAVILASVVHALWMLLRNGDSGTRTARQRVANGIVSGLGLTTAIALLATTQLRSWNAIGLFAAAAAIRTFVKYAEQHLAR